MQAVIDSDGGDGGGEDGDGGGVVGDRTMLRPKTRRLKELGF